jgi:hypothetical protein
VTLGLGIAALWVETNEALLAAFIVAIVALWGIETLFHAGAFTGRDVSRRI